MNTVTLMKTQNINFMYQDREGSFTSVWFPQLGALGLKPTEAERATLGPLSREDQEIVTGPGDTRTAALGYAEGEGSPLSAWGLGEALGAGAPGTRLGIWPSEGKDVLEKGEGAGLRGGGVGV